MKKKWAATLLVCSFLLPLHEAMAKRMGRGGSMGRQSSQVMQRQATPPAAPAPQQNTVPQQNAAPASKPAPSSSASTSPAAAAAKPAASGASRWTGAIAGLAAGLGLAWLASSLGLGSFFSSLMLIGLLVILALFIWTLLRRRIRAAQPSPAYAGAKQYSSRNVGNDASARPWEAFETVEKTETVSSPSSVFHGRPSFTQTAQSQNTWGIPQDFDVHSFLQTCKKHFVTLQAAWDRGDVDQLAGMMTDDMLFEIKQQLEQRKAKGETSSTEVITLEAQLLGIEETIDDYLASVEFNGVVKEDGQAPSPFREVWNIAKSRQSGSGWLVAGVQALD